MALLDPKIEEYAADYYGTVRRDLERSFARWQTEQRRAPSLAQRERRLRVIEVGLEWEEEAAIEEYVERRQEVERRRQVFLDREVRFMVEGKLRITGYAIRWDEFSLPIPDKTTGRTFVERIARGAFLDSIAGGEVLALYEHDAALVLGSQRDGSLQLTEDDRGLRFTVLPGETDLARAVAHGLGNKSVCGASFSFTMIADEWDGDVRTVTAGTLAEISIVSRPAYPCDGNCAVELSRSLRADPPSLAERRSRLEKLERDAGRFLPKPAPAPRGQYETAAEYWQRREREGADALLRVRC